MYFEELLFAIGFIKEVHFAFYKILAFVFTFSKSLAYFYEAIVRFGLLKKNELRLGKYSFKNAYIHFMTLFIDLFTMKYSL